MSRRGRPRHPDILTPAEWRVLEEIRQGRPNAEIAVRLGLSVNTVRFHVSNMLAKLDLSDRHALARWRRYRRRWAWVAGGGSILGRGIAVLAVGMAIGVLVIVEGGRRDGSSAGVAPTPSPSASPATANRSLGEPQTLPLPQTTAFRTFSGRELAAAGFIETGVSISVPYNPFPAAESAYRGRFTVLQLAAAGYLRFDGTSDASWSPDPALVQNAVSLEGTFDGVSLRLTLSQIDSSLGKAGTLRILEPAPDGIALYSADASVKPIVGVELIDRQGRRYPVVADNLGRLLFRPAPVTCNVWAVDTGECLEVARAVRLDFPGTAANVWQASTTCAESPCRVMLLSVDQLVAPTAGTVACNDDAAGTSWVEFTTPAYRLRFDWIRIGGAAPPSCAGVPVGPVREGAAIAPGAPWLIKAFDATGVPIPLAAGRRTLYVGGFAPTVTGCPCVRPGN